MQEPLVIVLLVLTAVIGSMAFYHWRINRLQYPVELRWPKPSKRRVQRR